MGSSFASLGRGFVSGARVTVEPEPRTLVRSTEALKALKAPTVGGFVRLARMICETAWVRRPDIVMATPAQLGAGLGIPSGSSTPSWTAIFSRPMDELEAPKLDGQG